MFLDVKYIASEGCAFQHVEVKGSLPWRCYIHEGAQKKTQTCNAFVLHLMATSLNVSLKFNDWVGD